jgi:ABC-2 type transport system ATP-binding protein
VTSAHVAGVAHRSHATGPGPRVNGDSPVVIDVEGLTKRFGPKTVVDDFALQVRRGQIYGFLGPNGSGKTTTIRMLCGLLTPDAGRGTCLGYDILTESAKIKREVGYMTQKFSLYEDLSIAENLDFIGRMYQVADRERRVRETIDRLGLASRKAQLAGTLSGGWKQRLALAACMLHDPKLLLLDEPTAGVDPGARRDFWDQIHRLAGEGMTVLVSTHYMDEAERCHALAYIAYGKLLTHGTIPEVVAEAGLSTWEIESPEAESLFALTDEIEKSPGVEMAVPFGNRLHASGTDATALKATMDGVARRPGLAVRQVESSLEDVFIHMMRMNQPKA